MPRAARSGSQTNSYSHIVLLYVTTGRTFVKRLPATRETVVDAERALYGRLARAPASGGVELF